MRRISANKKLLCRPGTVLDGTYKIYESSKRRSLLDKLGNITNINIKGIADIEYLAYSDALQIVCPKNTQIFKKNRKDGTTQILIYSMDIIETTNKLANYVLSHKKCNNKQ